MAVLKTRKSSSKLIMRNATYCPRLMLTCKSSFLTLARACKSSDEAA